MRTGAPLRFEARSSLGGSADGRRPGADQARCVPRLGRELVPRPRLTEVLDARPTTPRWSSCRHLRASGRRRSWRQRCRRLAEATARRWRGCRWTRGTATPPGSGPTCCMPGRREPGLRRSRPGAARGGHGPVRGRRRQPHQRAQRPPGRRDPGAGRLPPRRHPRGQRQRGASSWSTGRRSCTWSSALEPTRRCPCRGCGPAASWSRSAPPTCASPPRRPPPTSTSVHDLGSRPRDVEALESRTEGWAAALQLAAAVAARPRRLGGVHRIVRRGRPVRRGLPGRRGARPAASPPAPVPAGHLRAGPPVRSAVRRGHRPGDGMAGARCWRRWNGATCSWSRLDDHRRWYRYHHLFADVLQSRLLAERPDDVPALHRRASGWYEQAGRPGGGGPARVRGRRRWTGPPTSSRSRHPDLRRQPGRRAAAQLGGRRVPPEVLGTAPGAGERLHRRADGQQRLRRRRAAARRPRGGPGRARPRRWSSATRPSGHGCRRCVATHRAGLALVTGDLAATITPRRDRARPCAPADDQLTAASASALKGLASWAGGDLGIGPRGVPGSRPRTCRRRGTSRTCSACTVTLVDLELQLGRPGRRRRAAPSRRWTSRARRGRGEASRARDRGHVGGAEPGGVGARRRRRPLRTTCTGPATSARPPAFRSSRTGGGSRWRTCGKREGDTGAADALLAEAERLFNSDFSPDVRPVPAVRARLHIRVGDLAAARSWAAAAGVAAERRPRPTCASTSTSPWPASCWPSTTATGDQAASPQAARLLERLASAAERRWTHRGRGRDAHPAGGRPRRGRRYGGGPRRLRRAVELARAARLGASVRRRGRPRQRSAGAPAADRRPLRAHRRQSAAHPSTPCCAAATAAMRRLSATHGRCAVASSRPLSSRELDVLRSSAPTSTAPPSPAT